MNRNKYNGIENFGNTCYMLVKNKLSAPKSLQFGTLLKLNQEFQ